MEFGIDKKKLTPTLISTRMCDTLQVCIPWCPQQTHMMSSNLVFSQKCLCSNSFSV